ncbi:MAG: hypothetical protein EUB_03938 [Eubacterium sp.]
MIMKVLPILMGCDDHLKTVTPEFLGQLHADLVGLLGGDLSGGKALIAMIGYNAAFLMILLFGQFHFLDRGFGQTIEPGHKEGLLDFIHLGNITGEDFKGFSLCRCFCKAFVFSFVMVEDVVDHMVDPAMDVPDFGGGHFI